MKERGFFAHLTIVFAGQAGSSFIAYAFPHQDFLSILYCGCEKQETTQKESQGKLKLQLFFSGPGVACSLLWILGCSNGELLQEETGMTWPRCRWSFTRAHEFPSTDVCAPSIDRKVN